jgi:DNA-binding MarR family transcriptional regulator
MQDIQRQILQLCSDGIDIDDLTIASKLEIDIHEVHFHLDKLSRGGFIKLMTSSTYDGDSYHIDSITPKGRMVLQGKIPLETENKSATSSQTFNITNNAPTGAQQFGNENNANITQSIGFDTEIRQIIEELKQSVHILPIDNQDIATHALSTIQNEAASSQNQLTLKTALFALWSVAKDVAGFANAVTALAQRLGIHFPNN